MRLTKADMLEEMDRNDYFHDLNQNSKYKEIKEVYDEFLEFIKEDAIDISDESDMFPNGRDYDAEDEDFV